MKAFPMLALLGTIFSTPNTAFAVKPEIEAAFVCAPYLNTETSFKPGSCFSFRACLEKSPQELEKLSEILEDEYISGSITIFGIRAQNDNGLCKLSRGSDSLRHFWNEQRKKEAEREAAANKSSVERALAERANKEKMEKEQEAAEQAREIAELQERRKGLLNGSVKIANFRNYVAAAQSSNPLCA